MASEVDRAVQDKIVFFPEQIQWLEKMFPTRVLQLSATEAEMRDYFGTQRVLEAVRQRRAK